MSDLTFIKLSELTGMIRRAITHSFEGRSFWVVGDVTNHNFKAGNNWHFFALAEKEEGTNQLVAKIDVVAWKPGAAKIAQFETSTGQQFQNDIHVLLRVAVVYNQEHGLKLELLDIDPSFTIGVLEKQKQDILTRLLKECSEYIEKIGEKYVTRNSKLRLKPVIQRIALVASPGTAGYEDFIHTIENNSYNYTFVVDRYFTSVQGQHNSILIRQKLVEIYNSQIDYDAVVIIRGGGAQTDFLIFETFELGQAVAKFPVPVITGIGHLRNETIVDLMAHSPTNAPTKAAEYIIAHNKAFEEKLINVQKTVLIKSQQICASNSRALSSINSAIVNNTRNILGSLKDGIIRINQIATNTTKSILFSRQTALSTIAYQIISKPTTILSNKQNDFKNLIDNFTQYARIYFQRKKGYLGHHDSMAKLMNPENLLKRGFALLFHKGEIITNADTVSKGSEISVLLHTSEITAIVQSIKNKSDGTGTKL